MKQLTATIAQTLIPVMLLIGLAVSYLGIESDGPAEAGAAAAVMATRPHAEGSAAGLIAAHDCWTSEGPAGVIPGHVVAQREGAVAPTYGGPRLVGPALDQLFGGVDHGLTVYAFCR